MADDKTFTKAELDAAVKAATDKIQESIDRLEAKNEELIADRRKALAAARAASEIKPEDLTAAEERADKAEARIKELEKVAKDATSAKEKAEKALADESGFTHKLLIRDGLKSALLAAGVKDEDYLDMAVAKFSPNAKVVIDGEERRAMLGDKSLSDAIKEWAATDAGKKVVSAAMNTGGGASGAKGADGAKTATQAEIDALPPKERASFFNSGGTVRIDA